MGSARLYALVATILFSTGGAAIKTGAFTGMQVSSVRAGIAVLALLLLVRGRVDWSPRMWGIGAVYAASLTLFVNATKLTTAANAIFIQSTAPLWIVLVGPFLLHERLRRRDLAYMLAVGAGVALCVVARPVVTATAPNPELGNLLAVVTSVTWAFTLMLLRWAERARPGVGLSAVIVGNILACAAGLPFALPLPAAPAVEWATLAYLGIIQIGLAYVCLTRAVAHLPALEVSLILLLEPVLNPMWTWLIRGEEPGGWVIAGGAIIVAATAVKAVYDARQEH
ncbi:MAG: DMT family transporter [Acidimicrobiia bacterium]|nr:DMT family transporter [Acidimicrobiia bacterium]